MEKHSWDHRRVAASTPSPVRPALARNMVDLIAGPPLAGRYDDQRQLRLAADGSPLMISPTAEKTMTFDEKESADVAAPISEHTVTKTRRDPSDPLMTSPETTELRSPRPDQAYEHSHGCVRNDGDADFSDDAATGVVAF